MTKEQQLHARILFEGGDDIAEIMRVFGATHREVWYALLPMLDTSNRLQAMEPYERVRMAA